jgi:acetylornithine/N-succinyldiaminopimelate aminotransferase
MAVGYAVLRELLEQNLAGNAKTQGQYLANGLHKLSRDFPISAIRGKGLLLAFDVPEGAGSELAAICLREGLLINSPNPSTVRLVPPLIVTQKDIDDMLSILRRAFGQLQAA